MRIKTALIASAMMLVAGPAMAERAWLLPSATIFSENEWVSFDAGVSSDPFHPDHQPTQLAAIKITQPDGQEGKIENAITARYRSSFDIHLDKPGTWRVSTVDSRVMGSFKVDGEEWRVGGRRGPPPGANAGANGGAGAPQPGGQGAQGGQAGPKFVSSVDEIPANATDIQITESAGRDDVFVTAGSPTNAVFQPTGKGLEMVPVTHPTELLSDEPGKLRFLVDGKPAAGLKVTIVPDGKRYRNNENAMELTTGADGLVTIKWPGAGMYWLNATLTDNHPSVAKATQRRMSYTATLEVMQP